MNNHSTQPLSRRARRRMQHLRRDDGMSTTEYAVGTVAAAGLGGLLLKLLTSPDVQQLLFGVISKAFEWVTG